MTTFKKLFSLALCLKAICSMLAVIITLIFSVLLFAQDMYKEDTVWTRNFDLTYGFYMVKFSNTDSIIAAMGFGMDSFFETKTGKELMRIPGNNEVFFINNDRNFIRLNEAGTKYEIFDATTYLVIDSLENDGILIRQETGDISKDERFLVAAVKGGFRLWDLNTKKILNTKFIPFEKYQGTLDIPQIRFTNGIPKIIATIYKEYYNPYNPSKPLYKLYHAIYDENTLDSIDSFLGMAYFRLSNTSTKIAFKRLDPYYGIEVYDFNTKQLLWKIPINGPSLTGIEFSPDDKYLISSNGPGTNALLVWDLSTGKEIHRYWPASYGAIDVDNIGKFILGVVGDRTLVLFYARFNGTLVDKENNIKEYIIYPNPSTSIATIKFYQPFPELTNIILTDINGVKFKLVFNGHLESGEQSIDFNTSDLPVGTYLASVKSLHLSLTFKLIIGR